VDAFTFYWEYARTLSTRTHHAAEASADGLEIFYGRQLLEAEHDVLLRVGQNAVSTARSRVGPIRLARLAMHAARYQFHHLCHPNLYYAPSG
jgi:hypothetical protein